jgi:hypothetical protein
MATKDWKKSEVHPNTFYHKESGDTLEFWKNSKTGKWSVTLVPTTGKDKFLKSSLQTEAKARAFANSYMRRN